ncbi:MAG: carbon storage regulator [Armatimonadetes bacterium]|nr:carbon storage regulator [Armatimonadota bacterium]
MLVLTRNVEQDIQIGRDIRIRILSVNGRQVQIGIDAPREITIYRGELLDAVREQNAAAASAASADSSLRNAAVRVRGTTLRTLYTAGDTVPSSKMPPDPIASE